jgi:16S rRNA C1402 N4-methylase RsmH
MVSKKPIVATKEELDNNKRSSSAKLRVIEKK